MNLIPQQPLIGMIFTNTGPRYAGRLDNRQIVDTIVTIETVKGAIVFNEELMNESTWLWLTLEQVCFSLIQTGGEEHEERAGDLDRSQSARDNCLSSISLGACNH